MFLINFLELTCIFQESDDTLCPETSAIREVPPKKNIVGTVVNYESSGPLLGYCKFMFILEQYLTKRFQYISFILVHILILFMLFFFLKADALIF